MTKQKFLCDLNTGRDELACRLLGAAAIGGATGAGAGAVMAKNKSFGDPVVKEFWDLLDRTQKLLSLQQYEKESANVAKQNLKRSVEVAQESMVLAEEDFAVAKTRKLVGPLDQKINSDPQLQKVLNDIKTEADKLNALYKDLLAAREEHLFPVYV